MYACLAQPSDGIKGGMYLDNCKEATPNANALDPKVKNQLWEITQRQIEDALQKRLSPMMDSVGK